MDQLEKLIDCIKGNNLLKPIWGRRLHITKPVKYDSSRGGINRMMQSSQEHIKYQVGMTTGEITGIINLDGTATLYDNEVVLNESPCAPVYIRRSSLPPKNHYLQKSGVFA